MKRWVAAFTILTALCLISAADARVQINNLSSFGAFKPNLEISNTASATDGTDLTTYTFSAQSIGVAESNRFIVVGAAARATANGRTISSVTIGGNSATQIVAVSADDGGNSRAAGLFGLVVPTGTTADIVVTFSGAMTRAGVGIWRIMGLRSATAKDTQTDTTSPTLSWTLDIPVGGVGIGVAFMNNNAGTTWTGLTEDFDNVVESNTITGAALKDVDGDSALSVTAAHTGSTANAGVTASWAN